MSTCRFMFSNLVTGPEALSVSSARPGMVGSPAAEALGSATCLAAGEHTGDLDQVLVVEIDSVEAGTDVGLATFRWKRESAGAWEAGGVPTATTLTPLADGVRVKWVPGLGQELYKGDRWSILATGRQGPQALMDRDRDTCWHAEECAGQWIGADLGQARQVRALVLADHNLGEGATATIKGTDTPEPDDPVWAFGPSGGALENEAGVAGANARSTSRTYVDGGVLKYAAPGESCFEDGLLSVQPAATNLLSRSEEFESGDWSKGDGSVSANQIAAPDEALTADKLVEGGPGSNYAPAAYRDVSGLSDNTIHALSVFAKAGERHHLRLRVKGKDGTYTTTWFDLSSGEVGTADPAVEDSGIVALAGGWYRCWVAQDVSAGGTTPRIVIGISEVDGGQGYDVDGVSGLYIWGAQLEAGRAPTAYIPTEAGTAGRDADAAAWSLPQELKDILSAAEGPATAAGTLVVRDWTPGFSAAALGGAVLYRPVVAVADLTYGLLFYQCSGGSYEIRTHDGSAGQGVSLSWIEGAAYDLAVRWSSVTGSIQVGYKLSSASTWTWSSTAAFDGALALGTNLHIGYSPSHPFSVGEIQIYGSWLDDPLEQTIAPWEYPAHSQALAITWPHLTSFLDQTYRYWRLELEDPDNPEGLLRASLIYLGGCFEPQRTFRAGYGRGTVAARKLTASGGGKLSGSAGALAAYYQLEFARLSAEDATGFEQLLAAAHAGGEGGLRPLFFTPFSDDPGQTLYCLPGAELARQQAPGGRWNLGLRLEEVVRTDV